MRYSNKDIVLGYDGSPDADLALEWATATAVLEGLSVRAVMVDHVDASPWSPHSWEPDSEHQERVEHILAEAKVGGSAERRSGHVVPTLLDAAEGAAMLVVGSQGHGVAGEVFLGSVSQHVARHASCPVVVVRLPRKPDAGQIVVGVDGSGDSATALEFACRRAELTGEVVLAIHGWRLGATHVDRRGNLTEDVSYKLDDAEVRLGEAVAGVRADHPDVVIVQEAIPVAPARALIDASERASLVVTGSRGRGAFAGTLLGSVSHTVLQHSHCPVAVVR